MQSTRDPLPDFHTDLSAAVVNRTMWLSFRSRRIESRMYLHPRPVHWTTKPAQIKFKRTATYTYTKTGISSAQKKWYVIDVGSDHDKYNRSFEFCTEAIDVLLIVWTCLQFWCYAILIFQRGKIDNSHIYMLIYMSFEKWKYDLRFTQKIILRKP